jgi:Golgi phosphoprotein 3 (GPP34)
VDLTSGVAVRVAALCLEESGRPADRVICGDAVRGGLLLDLALARRVESTDESIAVDPTPTGFGPADRLLAAIAVEPERSLDGWLAERRLRPRDVADGAVASGRWEVRAGRFGLARRYTDLRREETEADLRRSSAVADASWTPVDACVTAVAAAAGLLDRGVWWPERPADAVIAATGPVAWLCTAVVDHLLLAFERYSGQAGALGSGQVGPF